MPHTDIKSTPPLDLTPFCWHLERMRPRSVRLTLHCAPGLERYLRERLTREGISGLHTAGRGTLRTARTATVAALVLALYEDPLARDAARDLLQKGARPRHWPALETVLDLLMARTPRPDRQRR